MINLQSVVRDVVNRSKQLLLNPSFWVGLVIIAAIGFWVRGNEQERLDEISALRTLLGEIDQAFESIASNIGQQQAPALEQLKSSADKAVEVQSRTSGCVSESAAFISGFLQVMPAIPLLDEKLVRDLARSFRETAMHKLDQCQDQD